VALAFSRSLRALDADRAAAAQRLQWLLAGLALLWSAWFFGMRVPVLASADAARVEARHAAHRVQAPVGGRVIAVHQVLEREVAAGEVLVELDASQQEREREQRLSEQRAERAQLAALEQELRAVEATLASQREAGRTHVEEAGARQRQADALSRMKLIERVRSEDLLAAGVISQADTLRSISEHEEQRSEASARSAARRRIQADQRVAERERTQQLAELRRQTAASAGRLDALAGALEQVERAIEQRHVRAPIAGRLGDVAPITVGAVLAAGDTLSSVIPGGELQVVALLPPDEALGRIQPGQSARMRLYGFPWTQYGTLPCTVRQVAQEVREGRVRVELTIDEPRPAAIPLQHGLPGRVEIEIEQTSPASLVWRAVGGRLAPPTTTGTSAR
jgi:membrane fusion protein (multidrug efflux system)